MRLRLVVALFVTFSAMVSAFGETNQAELRKSDKRKVVPAQSTTSARPAEQKWVEDSINKFFDIPAEVLNPQPNRR